MTIQEEIGVVRGVLRFFADGSPNAIKEAMTALASIEKRVEVMDCQLKAYAEADILIDNKIASLKSRLEAAEKVVEAAKLAMRQDALGCLEAKNIWALAHVLSTYDALGGK